MKFTLLSSDRLAQDPIEAWRRHRGKSVSSLAVCRRRQVRKVGHDALRRVGYLVLHVADRAYGRDFSRGAAQERLLEAR